MSSVHPKTTDPTIPTLTTDALRLEKFREDVARLRASVDADLVYRPGQPAPVQIAGVQCYTGEQVVALYKPGPQHDCTSQEWYECRHKVREWVGLSLPASPSTTLRRIILTTAFVSSCMRDDVPLNAEAMLTPERVEQYVALYPRRSLRSLSTLRSELRSVGIAATTRAAWPRPPADYGSRNAAAPYSGATIAAYWDACLAQSTSHRRHVMATILSLGLGAGLRRAEMYELRTSHVVHHPVHEGLLVVVLPDRLVPLRHEVSDMVLHLCDEEPTGRLIGGAGTGKSLTDPLGRMREALDVPASLPLLNLSRLRTTWAVACLSDGANLAEFQRMAGTKSGRVLEKFAGFISPRDTNDDWMLPASGTRSATSPMPGLPMDGGNA